MSKTGGWLELRQKNRELAFILLFAPAGHRDLCADLLLLGFELDNAIHIPSEVMLAAIRLQWWREALTMAQTSNESHKVPLVARLQSHIFSKNTRSNIITYDDIQALIEGWQDRLGDDDLDEHLCWGGCWTLIARILNGGDPAGLVTTKADHRNTTKLGSDFMALLSRPELRVQDPIRSGLSHFGNPPIDGLPRCMVIAAHMMTYWRKNPTADSEDPLLIWRMLGWRLGFTPR